MSTFSCTGEKCPVRDDGVKKCTAWNCEDRTPATNADRIRAMSDEELMSAFVYGCDGRECPQCRYPHDIYPVDEAQELCRRCWRDWLKQEVET